MEFIQDEQKRKYIAINNIKHWIPDSETRNALGYRISNFKPISQIKMKSYQSGSPIESVRNVKLIRDKNNHKDIYALFIIPTNTKRHIPNLKTLEAMGRSQKQTEYVETDEFNSYPTGEPIDDVKNWDSLDKISSNKKSWQDNIFFYIFIGVIIILIGGAILGGIKYLYNKYLINDNKNITAANYEGSIYDLMRQINLKSTTLEKQEFINKYEGLKIEDKGYITNIYKIPESYFNDEAYSVTIQAATTTINNLNDWFLCGFSKEWEKKLTTMDLSKKVFFEGIISTGPVFLGKIGLKNCILK